MADWFLRRYREKQALVMSKGKTVTLEETTGKTADDFLVGRNVRVLMESSRSKMDGIWVESGEMQKYINCVGVVERIDEEIYVSFADGKNWYFYPEDLVPIGAKINCPETKDQPEILNFKVGDKVVVTQKFIPTKGRYNWPREMDKTIGKEFTIIEIKETCSYGTGIQLNNFWWYCPEALELVTEQSHDDADYFITEYYKDRTPTIEKQTTMDIPTNLITTPTLFRGTDITQMSSPSILSSIESLQHQKKNLSELKIESKAVAAGIKEIDSAINVLVKELDSRK